MSADTLLQMLTYRRPHLSRTERDFRDRFILSIPGAYADAHGNIHVKRLHAPSRTLWSAHTDTVHSRPGRQVIRRVPGGDIWELSDGARRPGESSCLGADDAVGCYILRELALADVPGWYVFHSGEERGGIGSSALAAASGDWLRANFDRAIAIDRRGTRDIITHQAGGRCCSDAFARALAAALTLGHAPSSAGIYTDTAEYVDHIGECTNISAGYTREHTQAETVDVGYVLRLTAALLATDVESLPTVRVPGEWEPTYSTSYTARGRRTWSGHWWPDEATGGLSADIDELTGDYIARDDGRIVPFTRRRRPELLDAEAEAVRRYLLHGEAEDVAEYCDYLGLTTADDDDAIDWEVTLG